jgi:hypothetical protein
MLFLTRSNTFSPNEYPKNDQENISKQFELAKRLGKISKNETD